MVVQEQYKCWRSRAAQRAMSFVVVRESAIHLMVSAIVLWGTAAAMEAAMQG